MCVVAMGEQFLQVKSSTFCSQSLSENQPTHWVGVIKLDCWGGVGGGQETKSVYTAFCCIFSLHKSMEYGWMCS